jgi:hypothetical protein
MTMRGGCAVAGVALAALALAGCTFGTPTLAKGSVEKTVSDTLADELGQTPEQVRCPEDLEGTVGTQMDCTIVWQGRTVGLTVTVTAVDGTTVKFDIDVAEDLAQGS